MKVPLFLFSLIYSVNSAKVLGIFPAPGYSQFILGEKLMRELTLQGHEVTVISPYEPNRAVSNYTTISTKEILDRFKEENLFEYLDTNIFSDIISIHRLGLAISEFTLQNKMVQQLLQSDQKFDLVISEIFFTDALMGFAKHFHAPLILFSSTGPSEWNNAIMGNIELPSILPVTFTEYTNNMSFSQRIRNSLAMLFNGVYRNFVAFPQHQALVNQYYPRKINLNDVISNVSLMLLNSHITTSGRYPLLENMIQIGGFHVETNPLPKDIQEFLDSASEGAIYFSLGTNLQSSRLSKEKLDGIIKAFSQLNQKVLWKFEDTLEETPSNLLVSKWLPQRDILAHPNVKLFITHGGLLSVTEAVFYGIPIVGIPVFGDQRMNIARAAQNGFGLKIHLQDLDEEILLKSIREILANTSYKENGKKLSELMKDQETKPLNRAVFWIEYILRHKTSHLKPSFSSFHWYHFLMIDIILSFTVFVVVVILTLCYTCKRVKQKNKAKID